MDSCPKELRPYEIAHKQKIKEMDNLMWTWFGNYALSAVSVAVEHNLAGKKAKSEYIKEPILSKAITESELTEEERYEKELQKALAAEEQWIAVGKIKGLPETVVN